MSISFVWIYRDESSQADELRWSIRSVVANYIGDYHIIVAGDRPYWYCGECLDLSGIRGRYQDAATKLHLACLSDRISKHFVWMHDDQVFCNTVDYGMLAQPWAGMSARPLTREMCEVKDGDAHWRKMVKNTGDLMLQHGYCPYWYATHLPHVFNKNKMLNLFETFDVPGAYLPEMLYGAMYYDEPKDSNEILCYLGTELRDPSEVDVYRNGRSIISHTHDSWKNGHMRTWLKTKFPHMTQYESVDAGEQVLTAREELCRRMMTGESLKSDFKGASTCEYRGLEVEELTSKICPKLPETVYSCVKYGKAALRKIGYNDVQACNTCPVTLAKLGI
jgi:hypothetical protein